MLQRVSNMVWKSTRSSQYLCGYQCGCEWTRSDSGIMECSVGNSCCQVLSPHWLPGISGMGHITDEERQSGCTIQYAFNSIDQTWILFPHETRGWSSMSMAHVRSFPSTALLSRWEGARIVTSRCHIPRSPASTPASNEMLTAIYCEIWVVDMAASSMECVLAAHACARRIPSI